MILGGITMKKLLVMLLAIAVIFTISVPVYAGTIYEDVEALTERVETAEAQITELQTSVEGFHVEVLPENTDLNTLGVGTYIIGSKVISETLLNKPTTSTATGIVNVVSGGSDGQLIMYYVICDKSIVRYYHRAYYTGAWGTWNEVETSDSGWKALTLNSGIGQHNSSKFPVRYRKIGKKVRIEGAINGITASDTTIATLPENFRPSKNVYFMGARNGGESDTYEITPSGQIILVDSSNDVYINSNYHFINTEFLID